MPELLKVPLTSAVREHRLYLAQQLRNLDQHFNFVDSRAVVDFLGDEPAIFPLLTESAKPLKSAFGENRVFDVRIQDSDDDRLLRVTAQLPVDFQNPEQALENFDTNWWLNNCHRSGAGLVFDYEIQDGI